MPELPEVETSRRGILPHLKDQTIEKIIIRQPKLRWVIDNAIYQAENHQITDVTRRAKYLVLHVENGFIVIHLGMSGSLRIVKKCDEVKKHDHVDLVLCSGTVLRYSDPRRFGAWLWTPFLEWLPQFKNLGPEPLCDDFNADYLHQKLQSSKTLIKKMIMNNHIVVGVGNIYASESLFNAHILPTRLSNSITKNEAKKLTHAIKSVLAHSIEQGGTTLKDFVQSDGKPGYFSQKLHVYGRANQPCDLCGTLIKSEIIAQRNTFYCPFCQH